MTRLAWTGLALGVLSACSAPGEPSPSPPPAPPGPLERRLTARLGEVAFTATLVTVDRSGGTLFVSGSDAAERAIWFTMPDAGAGEYRIQPGVPIAAGVRDGALYFVASQTAGGGTIVITSIGPRSVTGQFTLDLVGDGLTLPVTAGQFTIMF